MEDMGKIISGLLGIGLLLQTYTADCASRKYLGIPEPGDEQCVAKGVSLESDNVYVKNYDTDGDGEPDLQEMYFIASSDRKSILRMKRPFGLWYDRNRNGKAELNELYFSPGIDEDWEKCTSAIGAEEL